MSDLLRACHTAFRLLLDLLYRQLLSSSVIGVNGTLGAWYICSVGKKAKVVWFLVDYSLI